MGPPTNKPPTFGMFPEPRLLDVVPWNGKRGGWKKNWGWARPHTSPPEKTHFGRDVDATVPDFT